MPSLFLFIFIVYVNVKHADTFAFHLSLVFAEHYDPEEDEEEVEKVCFALRHSHRFTPDLCLLSRLFTRRATCRDNV